MINVPISFIQGPFFCDGVEYKFASSYNSRYVCRRVDDPTVEVQFSAYTTVQVTEEQAQRMKFIIKDCIPRMQSNLREMEETLKILEDQKVPDLY